MSRSHKLGHITDHNKFSRNGRHKALADPAGVGTRDACPARGPNSFIFMKICNIIG